jgi:hypothetical protein
VKQYEYLEFSPKDFPNRICILPLPIRSEWSIRISVNSLVELQKSLWWPGKVCDVRLLTMHHGRDTGGPEGPSESEPVRLAPVLTKRSRPSGYIVDAIKPSPAHDSREGAQRCALAASGVASSQPVRPCLASAWSSCRPMFRVKEVVSEASEMLRSSTPHPRSRTRR